MRTITLSNSGARKLRLLLETRRDSALHKVDSQFYQRVLNAFSSKFNYKRTID